MGQLAIDAGIPKGELACRWVAHNSALKGELGDGMIIGTRSPDQLTQTLEWIEKGPFSPDIVVRIEQVWKTVAGVAPLEYLNISQRYERSPFSNLGAWAFLTEYRKLANPSILPSN